MHELSTILLVEDNADDADLIAHAFNKIGVTNSLVPVHDGEEALAYLHGTGRFADRARHPLPALVLLDLKLPRRSGFEVLADIRANQETRFTPVVILTSSDQDSDVLRAYELSANSYLVKPLARDSLVEMMRAVQGYWVKLNRSLCV